LVGGAAAEPVTITVLHTNDVYEISPRGGRGGLAELMTLLEQERAAAEHNITTFGGDLISPSVLSSMTEGAHMIDLYNRLDTDIAVLGNHEFDFGPEVARQRVEASDFPWLGTNVVGPDGAPAVGATDLHIMDVAGFKIGFFGLVVPMTATVSDPGPEITFAPILATAESAVERLEEQGVDLIVALTHLGIADDRALARDVDGIDLILGGHDHEPITFQEGETLIVKAGYDAHYLAAVDLAVDRVGEGEQEALQVVQSWRYLPTSGVAPDPEVQEVVERYNGKLDEDLSQPVGTTIVVLDSRRATLRTKESNFGDLIADALRTGVGADAAIINSGGIRGDRTYAAGTVLTREDVLSELPYGDVTVLIEVFGAQLLAALENSVAQVEDRSGRFLQVSGMTFTYDASRPPGSRIVEVKVGGAPLDLAKTYSIATSNFVYGGGAGYDALTGGKAIIDALGGTLMASMVMDYIARQGEIAPQVEGRITRLN
jgi:2',3'-cyclic-nucleotide 2'-phosphodiesterase (5'-nucleotidase family)